MDGDPGDVPLGALPDAAEGGGAAGAGWLGGDPGAAWVDGDPWTGWVEDNFYVNADVSAEGHNWSSAAIAPDYTVKMWPNSYAGRRKTYDYEGGEPAILPPAGYIWTNALAAEISLRMYGVWDTNLPADQVRGSRQIATVKDPALQPYEDMDFRAFDLDYLDMDRAKEFLREWKGFEEKGEAPQLIVMRLPNDHTAGVTPEN